MIHLKCKLPREFFFWTSAFLFFISLNASAEEIKLSKPLVEVGVAGGAGVVPDYPASNETQFRYLIFPVVNLRGKILRSDDEDGSRARLLSHSIFAVELGSSGSFPASSASNAARTGMDDLEWLGELGPRVFANLYSEDTQLLRASLSVRGAASTDFAKAHYRGITVTPGLAYDHRHFGFQYLSLISRLSPQWASQEMQEYFYGVPDRDALPHRRAYGAKSGYIGTTLTGAFTYEPGAYGLFAGISINFHDGAANEASPLFRERITYAGFVGFRYYFYKSNALGYL